MLPGEHVILVGDLNTLVQGSLWGLELRDTINVLLPGPCSLYGALFRKPLSANSVVAQVLATGTGGINIAQSRVVAGPLSRWPANLVLIHSAECLENECVPGCPVYHLDAMTKETLSQGGSRGAGDREAGSLKQLKAQAWVKPGYGDIGKASRYFAQFRSFPDFLNWIGAL